MYILEGSGAGVVPSSATHPGRDFISKRLTGGAAALALAPVPAAEHTTAAAVNSRRERLGIFFVCVGGSPVAVRGISGTSATSGRAEDMRRRVPVALSLSASARAQRAVFAKISIDSGETIVNEVGQETPTREFLKSYTASFTPTVLFLDADKQELADAMVGLSTPDYYVYYLEKSIEEAISKIHQT